jgi:hypothetical protein
VSEPDAATLWAREQLKQAHFERCHDQIDAGLWDSRSETVSLIKGYRAAHASRDPEVAALRAEVERLREELSHYAKTYCDSSQGGGADWCGALSELECVGCRAVAALRGATDE